MSKVYTVDKDSKFQGDSAYASYIVEEWDFGVEKPPKWVGKTYLTREVAEKVKKEYNESQRRSWHVRMQ